VSTWGDPPQRSSGRRGRNRRTGSGTEPVPVSAALTELLLGLAGPDRSAAARVFLGWGELVGPALAAHARPRSLRDRVLTVEADDPTWAAELRRLTPLVLERLTAELGARAPVRLEVRVLRGH